MKLCFLDCKTLGNDIDLSIFNTFGEFIAYQLSSKEEVIERIKDVDIIITNKVQLNKTNLCYAKNLKLICLTATGTNNIDFDYIKQHNIAVTNVAGYSTDSVVQHTFAILFYIMEKLSYYDNYVKSREYVNSDVFTHLNKTFLELKNKTWGIIGLGAIGKSVANIAKAFGCKIIYYSTTGKNNNNEYEQKNLEELLTESDIISIHCPLTPQTINLIDYNKICKMKRSAFLLNLGRGGIINEKDLAKAIDDELLAGVALDVLENEPILEDNPLLAIKNSDRLLITPHIAWGATEARNRVIYEVSENIKYFLNGEKRNRVDL